MRILRISISNIASLDGRHAVDFTTEPLRSAGLFSISGATGSGKSSLLDAMCLALYDRTPRLQGVGRLEEMNSGEKQSDSRSLLRRGCAEGMAEVAFEGVDGNVWTARWSVRRARKKATGKLQAVDMALLSHESQSDVEGVLHVGGKKTEVLAAIQERIGLTFEQFTRAVLLAQNDFATFLKADDKDRAEILQALTGTEQFEAISKAAYERQSTEKKALENLQARLQGAAPLSPEARETAELELREVTKRLEEKRTQIRQLDAHQEWFRQFGERQTTLTKTQQHLSIIQQQVATAAPRQQELKHTEVAQREARTLNDQLNAATKALTKAVEAEQSARKNLAVNEDAVKSLTEQRTLADEAAKSLKTATAELRPVLRQARTLDAQLEPAQRQCTKALEALNQATEAVKKASFLLEELEDRHKNFVAEQVGLQQELAELNHLAPFARGADHWRDRLDALDKAQQSQTSAAKRSSTAQDAVKSATDKLHKLASKSADLLEAVDEAEGLANAAMVAAKAFDADQLAASRESATSKREVFAELKHYLDSVNEQRSRAAKLTAAISEVSQKLSTNREALQSLQAKELPEAKSQWEGMVRQFKSIQSAIRDDAIRLRTELQDDQPCPVCGSLEHPYHHADLSSQNVAVKAARESVAQAEADFQQLQREEAKLESNIAAQQSDVRDRNQELSELELQLADSQFPFADDPAISDALKLDPEAQLQTVQRELLLIEADLKRIAKDEAAQRTTDAHQQATAKSLQKTRDAQAKHEKKITALESDLKVAKNTLNAARDAEVAAKTQVENASLPLQELWATMPNAQAEFQESPQDFTTTFFDRATRCSALQQRKVELASELKQLDASVKPQQDSVKNLQTVQTTATTEHEQLAAALKAISDQRLTLLDGRAADEVEQQQTKSVDDATETFATISKELNDAEKHLSAARKEHTTAEQLVAKSQKDQTAASEALAAWRDQFAISYQRELTVEDLTVLLSRSSAWFEDEQAAIEKLQSDLKTTEGAVKELTKQLVDFQATRPTEQTVEEVAENLKVAQEAASVIDEERDQLSGHLRADDMQRTTNAALTQKIQTKQKAIEPWLKLNDLIGSADGAKFRGIAQRQTLDILLSYANVHLQQLSSRYRLERLPDCLNLIIVDLHMAEERRSVFSLSGGESFLVSLALALGLASLTSNRLRIESLFIDEGFGSLDPETLSIAMSALMHLEAQGRKVGVISHVAEMTEAIPVQIKVVKASNGASKLVVPSSAHDKRPGANAAGL